MVRVGLAPTTSTPWRICLIYTLLPTNRGERSEFNCLAGWPIVCEKGTTMAEIFRPTYTIIDPETGKRTKKKSRTWHVRYYTPDGQRHRVKGYRDKKATETKAAELEKRGIRLDAGLTDPTDEHVKRPLAEHLADYRRYMDAKGNTPEHAGLTEARVRSCLDACRFVRVADIQPSAVLSFLADLPTR